MRALRALGIGALAAAGLALVGLLVVPYLALWLAWAGVVALAWIGGSL